MVKKEAGVGDVHIPKVSRDVKNRDEEYIKIELIVHKDGLTQEEVIELIRNDPAVNDGFRNLSIEALAVTGIESVDSSDETNEFMDESLTGATLGEGQDIIAEMFLKKHPMWIVATNCPKCSTPNEHFPCKRCGSE